MIRSQCALISSNRHSAGPITLPHSCFDSAMPMVSALRSV